MWCRRTAFYEMSTAVWSVFPPYPPDSREIKDWGAGGNPGFINTSLNKMEIKTAREHHWAYLWTKLSIYTHKHAAATSGTMEKTLQYDQVGKSQ